jgi:hypothetical protein
MRPQREVAGGTIFWAVVTLAAGSRLLAIQAVDEAGNIGPKASVPVRQPQLLTTRGGATRGSGCRP